MPDAVGNVLNPPGTTQKAEVKPDEILASYARFTQKGVTLAGGQGLLPAGLAIGKVTATKKYKAYGNANTDGTQDCKGFLRDAVDTGTVAGGTSQDKLGNIVVSGILKNSKLTGLDAAGIADLNGRTDADRDYFIF